MLNDSKKKTLEDIAWLSERLSDMADVYKRIGDRFGPEEAAISLATFVAIQGSFQADPKKAIQGLADYAIARLETIVPIVEGARCATKSH